ncbi:helix-turn-helix domain-containing protein [Nocardiopsis sp. CNT-189]|uniref:helix-turn-helix domain-containing protein n=1 Tax=Nocardiopsis oceanisediminis TaxID=2816862 RepID=UPI003B2F85D6
MNSPSPPPPGLRKFGREVRRLRKRAGLTQGQLAERIPLAQSMVSDIEAGKKATQPGHIARIDSLLGAKGSLNDYWQTLDGGAGFDEYFQDVVPLQQRAEQIREYNPLLVPGLLQVEEYTWATLRAGSSIPTDAQIEAQVRARIERQSLLERADSPFFIVVLDEAALRRPIGGAETMLKQLDHLLNASSRTRVAVQVVPMATEAHPALDGGFQILDIPEQHPILYLETRVTGNCIEASEPVETYIRLFEALRGVALPEAASRELITKIRGEL